jgi:hypothetical protein
MPNIRVGMRFPSALSALLLTLVLAGCMGDDDTTTVTVRETVTETTTGTVPETAPAVVKTYFLVDGKVAPLPRPAVAGPAVGRAALEALLAGPGEDRGYETAIADGTTIRSLSIANGVAAVTTTPLLTTGEQQAQLVYTLTQFPTVKRVSYNGGRPTGRAGFEAQTPAILVESPLPGEEVEPGFEVTGTANTFEATFNYELRDSADKVLAKNFVTATSGSGTRGTFRFTIPYEIDKPQNGRLVVFELSAADGSRINERSTPLRLG